MFSYSAKSLVAWVLGTLQVVQKGVNRFVFVTTGVYYCIYNSIK